MTIDSVWSPRAGAGVVVAPTSTVAGVRTASASLGKRDFVCAVDESIARFLEGDLCTDRHATRAERDDEEQRHRAGRRPSGEAAVDGRP
jgi:hypothetical protein